MNDGVEQEQQHGAHTWQGSKMYSMCSMMWCSIWRSDSTEGTADSSSSAAGSTRAVASVRRRAGATRRSGSARGTGEHFLRGEAVLAATPD